ncbi:MAG: D-tyrosyl-tRNA(Tyr) deacylase [Chloroflexi bacterium]|nr:D-tyrosyl-tRNA(Tyr) deacylase [Chloroflexota bacterium]
MRALLQRVSEASVVEAGVTLGQIGRGWLVLLGVGREDTEAVAQVLAEKVVGLRCFEDADGKTNLSAEQIGAQLLVVSQFTLYADTSRGRRPGFTYAAPPEQASPLVDAFAEHLRALGFVVQTGRFGADMQVHLVNDGPFTLWLDSADLKRV